MANGQLSILSSVKFSLAIHIVYNIVDIKGRPIRGIFYSEELQPIEANRYIVEEVLREKRGPRGRKQLLVKLLGWAAEYNSWFPESDLVVLREAEASA